MPELNDDLFSEDDDETTNDDSDQTSGESQGDKSKSTEAKRIADLQSAKDKETARANKLQKQLDAIAAATKEGDTEGSKPPAKADGNVAQDAVLDMARMFAYQQNPKLAEYGLSMSDLGGSTPLEIAQSATELVARFEKIETQVRNKVLASQGLAPEIDSGAPPKPPRDFSTMSKEDFDKIVNAALNQR